MWLSFKRSHKATKPHIKKSRTKMAKAVKKSRTKSRTKTAKEAKKSRTKRKKTKSRTKGNKRTKKSRFGMGPGYEAPTSFKNGFAPYFGSQQPFVVPTEGLISNPGSTGGPIGSGPTNYQFPQMVYSYGFGRK